MLRAADVDARVRVVAADDEPAIAVRRLRRGSWSGNSATILRAPFRTVTRRGEKLSRTWTSPCVNHEPVREVKRRQVEVLRVSSATRDAEQPPVPNVGSLSRVGVPLRRKLRRARAHLIRSLLLLALRWRRLETQGTLAIAERRLQLCDGLEPKWRLEALQDLAWDQAQRGNASEAGEILDRIVDEPGLVTGSVPTFVWLERYSDARVLLTRSIEGARSEGAILRVLFDLTQLALLELRLDQRAALAAATEAIVLSEQMGNGYLLACNLPAVARVDAIQGRAEDCREHARRAGELGAKLGDESVRADSRMALALLALGEGRPQDAIEQLEPLAALVERNGIGEPSVLPFAPDLIEAYVRARDVGAARQALDLFRRQAETTDRRWALACVARCEGLLAADGDIDAPFGEALERHQQAGIPFDRGRTQLCYGERLRRANRRKYARTYLRAAAELFDREGAVPWAERARAELRATGDQVARRAPSAPEQLTPQELQIALAVAEGKTNRQAVAALFLSPKTIDFHLGRVYRKLDIHSRADLIRLFARDGISPAGAPPL